MGIVFIKIKAILPDGWFPMARMAKKVRMGRFDIMLAMMRVMMSFTLLQNSFTNADNAGDMIKIMMVGCVSWNVLRFYHENRWWKITPRSRNRFCGKPNYFPGFWCVLWGDDICTCVYISFTLKKVDGKLFSLWEFPLACFSPFYIFFFTFYLSHFLFVPNCTLTFFIYFLALSLDLFLFLHSVQCTSLFYTGT